MNDKDTQRQALVSDLTHVLKQLTKPASPGNAPLTRDELAELKRRLENAVANLPRLGSW